jgi:hypothetical protein
MIEELVCRLLAPYKATFHPASTLGPAGTNCCLLTAPIIFSLLLLIIQMLINNVFLSGDDFKVQLGSCAVCVCVSRSLHLWRPI